MNSPARQEMLLFFFGISHHIKNNRQARENVIELTFVVKNSFLKEKADLISTGDEIVSISLQVKRPAENDCIAESNHYRLKVWHRRHKSLIRYSQLIFLNDLL